jgi:prolipoprotein diacylglyceryl transferase
MVWSLAVLASFPSPSSNAIHIGDLQLRAYGLMIALGVFAAVWLSQKRCPARNIDPTAIQALALRSVPAGLIGARVYHVMTDWRSFEGRWLDVLKVWQGGLGIPGGMLAGVVAGVWCARRMGIHTGDLVDVVAPALPLAQAIGRIGNWFNQELFGRPTTLPWAVRIDPEHRPTRYAAEATYQPTFLYEMLWNLALVAFLLWLDRKKVVPRGRLLAVYVIGYGVGRLWVELLRIDPAGHLFGVRVNVWVSMVAIVGGSAALFGPTKKSAPESATDESAAPESSTSESPPSDNSASESGSELRDV